MYVFVTSVFAISIVQAGCIVKNVYRFDEYDNCELGYEEGLGIEQEKFKKVLKGSFDFGSSLC